MALPSKTELETLDYAFRGQPFIEVPTKASISLVTMDYAHLARPFVGNPSSSSASSERNIEVSGKLTNNSDRNIEVTGKLSTNSDRALEVLTKAIVNSNRDLETHGITTVNNDRAIETRGRLTTNSDIDVELEGTKDVWTIQRKTDGGEWQELEGDIQIDPITDIYTYIDSDSLVYGHTYCYRVKNAWGFVDDILLSAEKVEDTIKLTWEYDD